MAQLSLPLLAFDDRGEPVGVLQAIVPGTAIRALLHAGWPVRLFPFLAVTMAKVNAVAVEPAARGRGVASALLQRCA